MGKPSVTDILNGLSEDDLGEVLELIQRKAKGEKKRKQQRKSKLILPDDEEVVTPSRQGRKTSRSRRPRRPEFDIQEHRRERSSGRPSGRQTRNESLQTGPRENQFNQMSEKHSYKSDTEIDKKLIGGNQPTQRRDKVKYIEVECSRCKYWYDVLPNEVYRDGNGILQYICDDCEGRTRR